MIGGAGADVALAAGVTTLGGTTVTVTSTAGLQPNMRVTGTGIPAAILPKIFDSFFTSREDGTGLGLAIVKTIADAHGGTLVLGRSERLGGLRVELCLVDAGHRQAQHSGFGIEVWVCRAGLLSEEGLQSQ